MDRTLKPQALVRAAPTALRRLLWRRCGGSRAEYQDPGS